MDRLRRFLRYEVKLSISVTMLLVIVAAVVIINALWTNAPWGIFVLVGAGLRVVADAWRRHVTRRNANGHA